MAENIPPIISTASDPFIDSSGTFVPGTTAAFFFTFVDLNGRLYDPFDANISITDTDNVVLISDTAITKIELGKWSYLWTVPSTAKPGKYTSTLTYTVETIDGISTETFAEDFVVVEKGDNGPTLRTVASRAFLESLIGYTQRIPIFNEIVRFNSARTTGKLSFPMWNQTAGADILLNGEIQESGFTIDYWRGKIIFDHSLGTFDEVMATYNFRWFKDEELDGFIEQGTNEVNIWPPQTTYTIGNIPDRWIIIGLYAAAINVLRRWMMDIQFVEPSKIFGTIQRAQDVFSNMDTLKKNYEDNKNKALENKKYFEYAGLTKTVTVPEFTLPGGRCFAYDSLVTYLIDSEEVTSTIADMNEIFKIKPLRVLSDTNGKLAFADVAKIWESGTKPVLKIEDDQGNKIEVSEDHIMFIDDKEVPASKVVDGDVLTVVVDGQIQRSVVTSVNLSREVFTFDIEVPSTENLFVNNIKCHNSRWFRYLFKGA